MLLHDELVARLINDDPKAIVEDDDDAPVVVIALSA